MIEHTYKLQLETRQGTVTSEVEIESSNATCTVWSRFLLNKISIGEFDGLLLNRVAVRDWGCLLENSLQCEAFLNFLRHRPREVLDILSRMRILILLNMKLKPAFRGKGIGVQILKQMIEHPAPSYSWDIAIGWARSFDGKDDNKKLNPAAAKIFKHYLKHLPNCMPWAERSTFFLCDRLFRPGEIQVTNAADYLREMTQRNSTLLAENHSGIEMKSKSRI